MRNPLLVLSAVALTVLASYPATAQAPSSLSFQGRLENSVGEPVDSTDVVMTLKLYKGSDMIWSDTNHVNITGGVFNVKLGTNVPLDTIAFDRPIDLGVTLNGDGVEMTPRTALQASAYARALPALHTSYAEVTSTNSYKGYNVIGGAPNNHFDPNEDVTGATISGGGGFWTPFSQPEEPVPNVVGWSYGTIGGGFANSTTGVRGTIGGGSYNVAGPVATVAGGEINWAEGTFAAIGGGTENSASGGAATVPGGYLNQARGLNSFAAGQKARAAHDGTFVWNDGTVAGSGVDSLVTSAPNEFLVKATGGVTFFSNADTTTGVFLAPGSGAWASVSDVNKKTEFGLPDPQDVLRRLSTIPIRSWRYIGEDDSIVHMGPTAQDFYSQFGLGIDNRHIVTVDADGVSMAAIQGLYEIVQEQGELLRAQQAEIELLKAMVEAK